MSVSWDVLWGCTPQDSLITLETSLGKNNPTAFPLFVPDNSFGLSTVSTNLEPNIGSLTF